MDALSHAIFQDFHILLALLVFHYGVQVVDTVGFPPNNPARDGFNTKQGLSWQSGLGKHRIALALCEHNVHHGEREHAVHQNVVLILPKLVMVGNRNRKSLPRAAL